MSNWKPQPDPELSPQQRSNFFAGYSDGYHGYQFGAGHQDPKSSPSYENGWETGRKDASAESNLPIDWKR